MPPISLLDATAALVAAAVVVQSLTLGAIQALRLRGREGPDTSSGIQARAPEGPLPTTGSSEGVWLLLTLLVAAVPPLGDLVHHLGLVRWAQWASPAQGAALLLVGPALWFYAVAITRLPTEAAPSWRRFAVHAIPAGGLFLMLASELVFDPTPPAERADMRAAGEVAALVPIAVQILVYLGAVIWRVRRQRPRLEALFSRLHHRQLRWLEVGAAVFAVLVVVWIGSWSWPVAVSNLVTNGLLALDVAVLGVYGARQRNVFDAHPWRDAPPMGWPGAGLAQVPGEAKRPPDLREALAADQADAVEALPKYAKAVLPPDLAAAIEHRLAKHVEVDRPYLECDLTLGDLAAAVGATPHQLSQVLSTRLGLNFFEYVNGLRVEAVKATLARPTSSARPLLEIALECGFGSKSAFNDAFRRATGMSPSAWRRSRPAAGASGPVGPDART